MAVINRGELVVQGDVKTLLDAGEHHVIITGSPSGRIRKVLASRASKVRSFRNQGGAYHAVMDLADVPRLVKLLVKNGVSIGSVVPRRSLEDYFLSITESTSIV
jgi:hypothetical protein